MRGTPWDTRPAGRKSEDTKAAQGRGERAGEAARPTAGLAGRGGTYTPSSSSVLLTHTKSPATVPHALHNTQHHSTPSITSRERSESRSQKHTLLLRTTQRWTNCPSSSSTWPS